MNAFGVAVDAGISGGVRLDEIDHRLRRARQKIESHFVDACFGYRIGRHAHQILFEALNDSRRRNYFRV